MEQFIWRALGAAKVPQAPGAAWTPALDGTSSKRFYRLKVKDGGKWKLDGATVDCTADGDDTLGKRVQELACPGSPRGALIAKVGGSTADKTGIIFAIGRYCVFQIEEAKVGPLYLGANDLPEVMSKVEGQIEVEIEIAL